MVIGQPPNTVPIGQPTQGWPTQLSGSIPANTLVQPVQHISLAPRPPAQTLKIVQAVANGPPSPVLAPAACAAPAVSQQQHTPSAIAGPAQSLPATQAVANGPSSSGVSSAAGATPAPSQQQRTPPGISTAATAANPQGQPSWPSVALDGASGRARAAVLAAERFSAPPQLAGQTTGQKRTAEPLSAQDVGPAKQPRTYYAQAPVQPLPQPVAGQIALPTAVQSMPPAIATSIPGQMALPTAIQPAIPAIATSPPSAPSAELAFQEHLKVITDDLSILK